MEDEADIVTGGPVALGDDPLVHQNCCGTALDHVVDGLLHVDQPRGRPCADPVVHGHDDRIAALPVYDPLDPDVLAEHFSHRATC